MTRHGHLYRSDSVPPRSLYYDRGRFGRLFPSLPPFAVDRPLVRNDLLELGEPGGIMDANDQPPPTNPLSPNPNNRDNPDQTAGVTFLGQFLDHDMTFDPASSLERQVDPEAIRNFRNPCSSSTSCTAPVRQLPVPLRPKRGRRRHQVPRERSPALRRSRQVASRASTCLGTARR